MLKTLAMKNEKIAKNISEYTKRYFQKQLENEYGVSTKNINLRKNKNLKREAIPSWKKYLCLGNNPYVFLSLQILM